MNDKIKNDFIIEASEINQKIEEIGIRFFGQAAENEDKLGLDICNWSFNQIVNYYKTLTSTSVGNILNMNSFFKKYTEYCETRNLVDDGINHFAELDYQTIVKTCLNEGGMEAMIFDDSLIEEIIDRCEYYADKALALALYEGIGGQDKCEFVELEPSMLETTTVTFKSSGRTIQISDRLRRYLIEAAEEGDAIYYKADGGLSVTRYDTKDNHCFKRALKASSPVVNGTRLISYRFSRLRQIADLGDMNVRSFQRSAQIKAVALLMKKKGITIQEALRDKELRERWSLTDKPSAFITLFGEFVEQYKEHGNYKDFIESAIADEMGEDAEIIKEI